MRTKKLLNAIGAVSDKHIEGAAPGRNANASRRQNPKKRFTRYAAVVACAAILMLATTAFAANYIQNSISVFYIRYLSPEEMAVADSLAEQYGAKIYFDGLNSDDVNKQYFCINKLVEYYNDENIRQDAIRAITPFLENEDEVLVDAAVFALSVLREEFNDPRIIHMANGTLVFTLFNNYSDYGSYNQIWQFKDGELSVLIPFDRPMMYITQIIPSPDNRLFAVTFSSNKSSYLLIYDLENGRISPELVDSARVMVARDLDIGYWQRPDFENYSKINGIWDEVRGIETEEIIWTNNSEIEFTASLWYSGDDSPIIDNVTVRYDFSQQRMECSGHRNG